MSKKYLEKALALATALAVLLSMAALFTIPAAAVDGIFNTYGSAYQEAEDYDGDRNSVAGYEYTEDGFHTLSADWTTGNPYTHVSTNEKIDLKQGVYMQVRIDEFDYDAPDKWISFNLWSLPTVEVGSGDAAFGQGVQALLHPSSNGVFSTVSWYTKSFSSAGSSYMSDEGKNMADGEERVLTLSVTWDGYSYNVEINGALAPKKVIDYMNDTYSTDSFAYVGFTMHSSTKGGSQSATILKFGTAENNAVTPMGDDCKDPQNYIIIVADIASPDTVADGQPAVLMTGDKWGSHLKELPKPNTGSTIYLSDGLVHVVGSKEITDCGIWRVDNEVSYDIKDFPVFMVMTKNFCSCGTGVPGECFGFEEAAVYLATGEDFAPNSQNKVGGLQTFTDPCLIDDDGYIFFINDFSSETGEDGRFNGRINSTRVDFNIDVNSGVAGANEFDVVMQGFFRTVDDAENYAMQYLNDAGYLEDHYYEGYSDGKTLGLTQGADPGFKDGFGGNYGDNLTLMDVPADADSYTRGYVDGYNQAFQSEYDSAYYRGQTAYGYYQEGYNQGYRDGLGKDGDYQNGFNEGYENGYNEGQNKGYNDGYNVGLDDGYKNGYSEGANEGYENGYNAGHDDGHNEGYQSGFNEGYNIGVSEGEIVTGPEGGYDQGFEEGFDKGYNQGYEEGFADGEQVTTPEGEYQDGYDDGYKDGYKDGKKENGNNDNNGNNGNNDNNGNNGNTSTEYDRGYNDGYADGTADMAGKIEEMIGGCEANFGSGAGLLILTVAPAMYFIFKRKKND